MSGRWYRGIQWVGSALTVLSLAFLVQRAWILHEGFGRAWPAGAWGALLSGAALCAGGGVSLVAAWKLLLARHGGGVLSFGRAFRVYAGSQIAKYIPGNVFQYTGRHLAGWQAGIPHHALIFSAAGEAVGLALVAVALSLGGLASTGEVFPPAGLAGAAACLLGYPFAQRVLRWAGRRWTATGPPAGGPSPREDWGALLAHALFFSAIACAFFLSAIPWTRDSAPSPGTLVSACSLAWLAGFATPGAPAGLGIRELVLVIALEGSLGRPGALGAAALFRGATTLGDLLLYAASLFAGRAVQASSPPE